MFEFPTWRTIYFAKREEYLREVLRYTQGNVTEAAKVAGVTRRHFYDWLCNHAHGVPPSYIEDCRSGASATGRVQSEPSDDKRLSSRASETLGK